MLRITDSLRLATTKLRTRKIRLSITVIISGILFAALLAGLTMLQAAIASLEKFDEGSLSGRYLVGQSATNWANVDNLNNPEIIAQAEARRDELIKQKQAMAKKLGIDYDPKSEPAVSTSMNNEKWLNSDNKIVQQLLKEKNDAKPKLDQQTQDKFATDNGAIKTYPQQTLEPTDGRLAYMADGQEVLDPEAAANLKIDADTGDAKSQFSIQVGSSYNVIDQSLLSGYLLANAKLQPGEVPLIIRYSEAELLLGLKATDPSGGANAQLERLKTLREQAGQLTFSACYRNSASQELLNKAVQQQKAAEAQRKKPSPDYVKPDFEYNLPSADSCGAVTIAKDNRTAEQKTLDAKQRQFDQVFDPEKLTEPAQRKFTFRVVGLMPNDADMTMYGMDGFLSFLMSTRLSYSWIIPSDMLANSDQADFGKFISATSSGGRLGQPINSSSTIYEFATPEGARAYMTKASCNDATKEEGSASPICLENSMVVAVPVGSNSLVIYDASQHLRPIIFWTFVGVTVLAAFILLIIISRTIADSRKESAVFRALGATRLAICQIYLTYTLILAGMTTLFSIGLGLIITAVADANFAEKITATLRVTMTPANLDTTFSLWMVDWRIIGLITLGILIAALLACALPLIRNTRRNPMRDMRDE